MQTNGEPRPSRSPLPAVDYTREETYKATRLPVDLASTLIPDATVARSR